MQFIMQPILVCVIFWEVRGRIWCSVSSGAMGGVSLLNVICSDSVIYNLWTWTLNNGAECTVQPLVAFPNSNLQFHSSTLNSNPPFQFSNCLKDGVNEANVIVLKRFRNHLVIVKVVVINCFVTTKVASSSNSRASLLACSRVLVHFSRARVCLSSNILRRCNCHELSRDVTEPRHTPPGVRYKKPQVSRAGK